MILAGDIGGTKTLLALFANEAEGGQCLKKTQYASSQYHSLTEVLKNFLSDIDCRGLKAACIGVAGAVDGDVCNAGNLPWKISQVDISEQIGTRNVKLINDLEASAWGVMALPAKDFVDLNPAGYSKPGNMAVLAAGTGLGESIIAWDGVRHHVIATEGGHADFAPNDSQEIALLSYLMKKYPGHVSYERLISGDGLVNIYQFLKNRSYAPVQPAIEQQMAERDPAAVIGEAGVNATDALCREAVTLFCRIYGAEAGNLALKCLPYAGVYLAGGIGAKILPALAQGEFMRGFLAKGRCQCTLQKIPVKVCTNTEAALQGAAGYAQKMSK